MSTHARLQSVSVPQSGAHVPVRQTSLAGQAVPHVPQFAGSVSTLAQPVLHWVRPVAQEHEPFVHAVPGMHGVLQAPQCALLVCVSVQAPAHAMPPPVHEQEPFVQA